MSDTPTEQLLSRLQGVDTTPGNVEGNEVLSTSTPQRYATAREAVAELERQHGPRSDYWTYRDAEGQPVGLVARWDRADGGKEIRPVARNGSQWIIDGMPEPRPLYRLQDLAAAKRIYLCEGEKAADAARSIGLVATTSPHGSKSAAKANWTPLAGKTVVILRDNDEAGRAYADDVIAILVRLNPAVKVVVVDLPGLPDHGDIVDWIDGHGDAAEPEELRQQVEGLADAAEPIWNSGPILVCMADVDSRPVDWLWPNRIAAGRITLLVGMPGTGKSFLTCDLAARVSTATPWPDKSECQQGSVILISAEDEPHDTIRPRLDAHYADVSRIHLLSAVRYLDRKGEQAEVMFTLADVESLEIALKQVGDCMLIVVDPIGSFLGGRIDAHRDNEVRSVLAPVAKLAEKYGPAVLVVAHRRKATSGLADDLAIGSRAFTGIARTVWHLTRNTEDKNRRLLLPGKGNLTPEQHGLAFSIVNDPARLVWERDPVAMTADEALALENRDPGQGSAVDEAATWLQDFLSEGPKPGKEVKEAARAAGIAPRTLDRAKAKLRIRP